MSFIGRLILIALLALLALVPATGCGDSAATCEDFVEVLLGTFERCGHNRDVIRAAYGDSMNCDLVKAVWDEQELREVCFPALEQLDCLALMAGLPIPLGAVQLLWLNLVTNGIQDVALAFEGGEPGVMTQKPSVRLKKICETAPCQTLGSFMTPKSGVNSR